MESGTYETAYYEKRKNRREMKRWNSNESEKCKTGNMVKYDK